MSYWFGITTKKYTILVSDRRRYNYETNTKTDKISKIFKVNDSIYITGAGLIPFVEKVVKDFKRMFNTKRLSLKKLKNNNGKLANKLNTKYQNYNSRVLKQLEKKGLNTDEQKSQCTNIVIGAVTEEKMPLLLTSYSIQSFDVHVQHGSGKFMCMPPLNEKQNEIFDSVINLIKESGEVLNRESITLSKIKKKAKKLLPQVIYKVASHISSVSYKGDITLVGYNESWNISFNGEQQE